MLAIMRAKELYIPHSSYKTLYRQANTTAQRRLYIPHSSYKTQPIALPQVLLSPFTSHIVHIKLGGGKENERNKISLHPT